MWTNVPQKSWKGIAGRKNCFVSFSAWESSNILNECIFLLIISCVISALHTIQLVGILILKIIEIGYLF